MPTRSKKKQSDEVNLVISITPHNYTTLKVPAARPKRSTRSANKKTAEDDAEITREE